MTSRQQCLMLAVVVAFVMATSCEREERALPMSAEAVPENAGGAVVLSSAQQQAIGLKTGHVKKREVADAINTTGWLIAKPGSEAVVKAPVAGFVTFADDASNMPVGYRVKQDTALAHLRVFLTPQDAASMVAAKENADTVIRQSLASLEIARSQLQRLETEAAPAVRGTRLQELREIVARAQAAHDEAQEILPFLPTEPYGDSLKLRDVVVSSPIDGQVVRSEVAPGQFVLQGDPLWTVADWSTLWIRIPVFVADLPRVVRERNVSVAIPGTRTVLAGAPVKWPTSSIPGRQTVDLFYEIDCGPAPLRPGQAMNVALPVGGVTERLVIPQTAVLWSESGDAAVYVSRNANEFHRRKIVLGRVIDDVVVVREGLKEGDTVVTTGAEALFGEEFRWQLPSEEQEED